MCAYSGGILSALGLQDADSAYEFSEEGSPHSPALSAQSAFSAFAGASCSQASCPSRCLCFHLCSRHCSCCTYDSDSSSDTLLHAAHHLRHGLAVPACRGYL